MLYFILHIDKKCGKRVVKNRLRNLYQVGRTAVRRPGEDFFVLVLKTIIAVFLWGSVIIDRVSKAG